MADEDDETNAGDQSSVGFSELLRMLRKAVQTMQLGVTVTDTHGRMIFVNPAEARLHGYAVEEMLGKDASLLSTPERKRSLSTHEMRVLDTWSRESVNRRKDGTLFPVHLMSDVVTDSQGRPLGIVTTAEDITERKRIEEELAGARHELESKVEERTRELLEANQALRISESRYRHLFERNLAAVYRTDLAGQILDCNESFSRMLGHDSRQDVLGRRITEFLDDAASYEVFLQKLTESGVLSDVELRLNRKDGTPIWILENASLVVESASEPPAVLRTSIEITQRKRAEEQLLHDALHDSLTGLANRALFLDRLRHIVARSRRQKSMFAVLFVDLDRFKLVNDSLGHHAGDRLLVDIAARLKGCARDADTLARLGGDEFTVLLEDIDGVADATRAAVRIQEALATPFTVERQEVFASASIGIALGGPGEPSPEDLLRDADIAMYRAKALGKARHEVFDAAMRESAIALLQMETDMRRALERQEFRVHYQPIVDLDDGALAGFEALLRWQHPQKGLILPMEFIPLAEETGLISAIGSWVLESACRTLASWTSRFPRLAPLTMSVNLSSKQFSTPGLVDGIAETLRRTGIDPTSLTLEITESLLIENAESAAALLAELRALGVTISLDDFGTGYSSLSYLHILPLQKLKIDRSFIESVDVDPTKAQIVRTIIALARALGLEVIAEGVESAAPLARLREVECGRAQGFYFGRPVPEETMAEMLAKGYDARDPARPDGWTLLLPMP